MAVSRAIIVAAAGLALSGGCGSRTGLLAGSVVEATPDAGTTADGASPCGSQGQVQLATGQNGPQALALDDAYVYWTNVGVREPPTGTIMRVPKCGGTPVTLATGQSPSWSIAVDDTSVYWGVVPAGDIGNGVVVRMPKAGGTIVTLATNVYDPLYVAVDATNLYWSSPVAETISSIPTAGGTVTTLATLQGNPHEIALNDSSVMWLNVGNDGGPGAVVRMPKAGGTPVTLAVGAFPSGLALDATDAISSFEAGGGAQLARVPLSGGSMIGLASVAVSVSGIATDGVDAYFTDIGNGDQGVGVLGAVPLQGGAVVTLASGLSGPSGVAVDGSSVYWLDDTGLVMKGPK